MKVLVTGHDGYVGSVLTDIFQEAGHQVVGMDSGLFSNLMYFGEPPREVESLQLDIRDVEPDHLSGFDAVVHLAAISNDPVGDLNPDATYAINHRATITLANAAKEAGVERFLFASSCSLYGSQGDGYVDESADFNPLTPYGESKVLSEADLLPMADDDFTPTFLRNATAYGVSPRLRGDVVVNNLTGFAFATGEVYLKSDGSSWRPLIHIRDMSRAFLAVMEADRGKVHGEAFNIGATDENYQIRDVAKLVSGVVPGSEVTLSEEATNDPRSYKVTCAKFESAFPGAVPEWTVQEGIEELYEAFLRNGLVMEDLEGDRFMRIRHIQNLAEEARIDADLRWVENQ